MPYFSDPKNAAKAGSKSKRKPEESTFKARKAFAMLLENNLDSLQNWIDELESPKEKLDIILKVAEFCVPKLQRVEMKADTKEQKTIEVVFVDAKDQPSIPIATEDESEV